MLLKLYESTEVNMWPRWLTGPKAVILTESLKYKKETSTKIYTPF